MNVKLVIGNKNYSTWSLRPWLAMRETGIEFEEQRIALYEGEWDKEIAKVSPSGCVPVLLIDDETIWDTMAIVETLAERWPAARLWPEEARARAHARSISAEMHSGFHTLRSKMPMNCRAMGRRVELPDELARDIDRVIAIWSDCHQRYGGEWLFGDFSIADAMYAPVVLRFRTYGINLPASAKVYANRLLESEAMQSWLEAAETEAEVVARYETGQ